MASNPYDLKYTTAVLSPLSIIFIFDSGLKSAGTKNDIMP